MLARDYRAPAIFGRNGFRPPPCWVTGSMMTSGDMRAEARAEFFRTGSRETLFFMHIPKTAGMSMRQYLGEQYHRHEICSAERWQDLLGQEEIVQSYKLVRGHFRHNLRELLAPDTKVLIVLRDPIRRTISALRHLMRDPNFHPTHALTKGRTLGELIRDPRIMAFQTDVQSRYLCASQTPGAIAAHLLQAYQDGTEADAGDLEPPPEFQLAADRLETIDFVGITENIADAVSRMAGEMSFHPPGYFPLINESPDLHDPTAGLSDEELALLRRYNGIDLKIYEFARKLTDWRRFATAMRRLVSDGTYQVPPGSFEIALEDLMPGSGWYPAEVEGDRAWRWSGPGRYCTIEVPLRADASYRFGMTFHDPRAAGPEQLSVEVNDFPVAFDVWTQDDAFRCEFDIDQALLAKSVGLCRIRFETGDPVRVPGTDIRPLGILAQRIEFVCVDE
jgi:hypothetical protein